eukprot:Nk52_evm36s352 gene=Nk52_evmTU36s352
MGIVGLGSDVIHIPRIQKVFTRYGARFLNRIYTPSEIAIFDDLNRRNEARSFEFLASRWALKESVYKCVYPQPIFWKDISLATNRQSRKPVLDTSEALKVAFRKLNVKSHHVTLTHDGDYAFCTVIIES